MKADFDIPAELQKIAFATLRRRLSIVAPLLASKESAPEAKWVNPDIRKPLPSNALTPTK